VGTNCTEHAAESNLDSWGEGGEHSTGEFGRGDCKCLKLIMQQGMTLEVQNNSLPSPASDKVTSFFFSLRSCAENTDEFGSE
jgi:hypothetical protein